MLTIRLHRVGRRNHPAFKIVVTDKTHSSTAGRFTEEVGTTNPATKERNLNKERILYWISVGAQPSPTVWNILVQEKIVEGKKLPKHKKPKAKEGEPAPVQPGTPAQAAAPTPAPEKPAQEAKPAETPKPAETVPPAAPETPESTPAPPAPPQEEKK
ncbi:MAG: 30S ribosomal protein S16 [Candidatus Wildermuthbacteria bacterium]|nr:30S ribosomal protein S16 [Candidatus Wildermuthbacteria bacterium]